MISPLAYVDPAAKLGKNVTVQPFAYIEADVEIGDDWKSHATLTLLAKQDCPLWLQYD